MTRAHDPHIKLPQRRRTLYMKIPSAWGRRQREKCRSKLDVASRGWRRWYAGTFREKLAFHPLGYAHATKLKMSRAEIEMTPTGEAVGVVDGGGGADGGGGGAGDGVAVVQLTAAQLTAAQVTAAQPLAQPPPAQLRARRSWAKRLCACLRNPDPCWMWSVAFAWAVAVVSVVLWILRQLWLWHVGPVDAIDVHHG